MFIFISLYSKSTGFPIKLVFFLLSFESLFVSISVKIILLSKSNLSLFARQEPFSKIILSPENTKSEVDSFTPLEQYTYPDIVFADCIFTNSLLYSFLPITSLLADKLNITFAPSRANLLLGGSTAHMSSHISIPKQISLFVLSLNNKSIPKGTFWPNISISFLFAFLLDANHLFS